MIMTLRSSANGPRDTGLTKLEVVPCGGVPKGKSPKEPIFMMNKQRILICLEFSTTGLKRSLRHSADGFCRAVWWINRNLKHQQSRNTLMNKILLAEGKQKPQLYANVNEQPDETDWSGCCAVAQRLQLFKNKSRFMVVLEIDMIYPYILLIIASCRFLHRSSYLKRSRKAAFLNSCGAESF